MTTEKPLSLTQSAYLVLLMAEAREVSNKELQKRYGVAITGTDSRALVDRKLATRGRDGQASTHELTEKGWAEARKNLTAGYVLAGGSRPVNAALHALLGAVHRHMQRRELSLAEIFAPSSVPEPEPPKAKPVDTTAAITKAYKKLKPKSNVWVSLAKLRTALSTLTREQVDAALIQLAKEKKIRLIPEENQKTINADVRAAAIDVGGEPKHLIAVEPA